MNADDEKYEKKTKKMQKQQKSANLGNNFDFLGLLNPQKIVFFSPNHLESLDMMSKYHIEVKCPVDKHITVFYQKMKMKNS